MSPGVKTRTEVSSSAVAEEVAGRLGLSVECVTEFSHGTLVGRRDAGTLLYNIKGAASQPAEGESNQFSAHKNAKMQHLTHGAH